jgi:hypothetical protein
MNIPMFCKGLVNMPTNIPTSTIVTSKWIQQGIINIYYVHRPETFGDPSWEDEGLQTQYTLEILME